MISAMACLVSCAKDPVGTYDVSASAVYFNSSTNSFSLIGKNGDEIELSIALNLVGPATDYDREVAIEIQDSTATENVDYCVVKSQVDSGALSGSIVIRVKQLSEDVDELFTRFTIIPNGHFPYSYYTKNSSVVSWTASYARPEEGVWRFWYLFFCNGYSKNLHKLLVQEFGTDIDLYTNRQAYVNSNPNLIYKLPTWWYAASRQFRDMVEEHDAAYPDSPYMHSADYESYSSYTVPVGEGKKPESVPTILETLMNY